MRDRDRKRAAKETGDGIRAWLWLRHVEAYLAAWRAHAVLPALESVFKPGPFPIRLPTAADLDAARFDLLAWADPEAADGPASPFRVPSGLSDTGRDDSLGGRLARGGAGGGSLELSFEATRRESANDNTDPEHTIGFRLTARW